MLNSQIMNKKNKYLTIRILILSFYILTASNLVAEIEIPGKKTIITEIETIIDGKTKKKFLLNEISLTEGKEFENYESLVYFMNEATQDLINMRVFESAEYTLEKIDENNLSVNYKVILSVKDTWNIYPIPYPKFDSNTGFRIGLKFYYFNMFGTLSDFTLFTNMDFGKNNAKDSWEISNWHVTPAVSGITLWGQDFNLELSQQFNTIKKYESGELQQEFTVHSSSFSLGTKLNLPLDFYYSMGPTIKFNYAITELSEDNNGDLLPAYGSDIDYEFSNLSWAHKIGYDSIDWKGNFREGFSTYVSNTLTAAFDLEKSSSFNTQLEANAAFFWIINKHFNLSGRINGVCSYNKEITNLGGYLRGVRDAYMYGYLGLFASIDMNISLIDWDGVGEIQVRPFLEIGIVDKENSSFDLNNDFAYTAGADFVLYLDKLNSMQARATFGVDLSDNFSWSDSSKYEVTITSSLSY